jgi:uncharacterized membrane protein
MSVSDKSTARRDRSTGVSDARFVRVAVGFTRVLGIVLRTGVLVSAAVVVCGGALYLLRQGSQSAAYGVFRGEPAALRSVTAIIGDAVRGSGRGIIQLGVILLIATPVARVAFSVVGFMRERDWLYAAVATAVLILLAAALTSH